METYDRVAKEVAPKRAALAKAEAEGDAAGTMQEVVDDEQIAQIVSRWTGVPVDKMLEGERDKLLRMEEDLAQQLDE